MVLVAMVTVIFEDLGDIKGEGNPVNEDCHSRMVEMDHH
jgi:hypothetical protein